LKEEARRHLRRAKRLLSSVEARVEAEMPEIVAHAVAVFVEKGIPTPKTHSGVVTRFSQLDRDQSLGAKAEVGRLSRGLERRLIADYDAEDNLTIEHARRARDDAVSFVSFCDRLIGVA
jgi:uncharacterized protein (UPF0332 family)